MNPNTFNTWELGLYLNQIRNNNSLKSHDLDSNREGKPITPIQNNNYTWFPSLPFLLNKEGIRHIGI